MSFGADIDATPLLKGLPGDHCPCPHWGYVLKGRLTYRFEDHDEVVEAGDAFYLPPGHIPVVEAGTELVQFSPAHELAEVAAVMERNAQGAGVVQPGLTASSRVAHLTPLSGGYPFAPSMHRQLRGHRGYLPMNLNTFRGSRFTAAALLALAAIAIGSIFGAAGSGSATIAVAPSNTAVPTISGTTQPGSTLTASSGTWAGTTPLNFAYTWGRCDKNGASCAAIGGANSSTYVLQNADVANTIRVTVTASNGDGTAQAASAATPVVGAPSNTTVPTISGTLTEGSTLTAANGTWAGATPLNFTYTWSRCDDKGNGCATISGATSSTYVLQHADTGNTVRVTVTGTNTAGNDIASSVPTAVIGAPAAPPTGCPSGTGVIQIGDLSAPARLQIDQQTITPGVVTPSTLSIQLHARVTACGGRPVQGALLYATAVPYNQFSIPPEGTTGSDGTVTLTLGQRAGFPAARQQQNLTMFLRARKSGEPLLAGISTRRLVSFPVSLKK